MITPLVDDHDDACRIPSHGAAVVHAARDLLAANGGDRDRAMQCALSGIERGGTPDFWLDVAVMVGTLALINDAIRRAAN